MRWVFAAAKKRKADRSKEREKKVFSFRLVKKIKRQLKQTTTFWGYLLKVTETHKGRRFRDRKVLSFMSISRKRLALGREATHCEVRTFRQSLSFHDKTVKFGHHDE